MSALINSCSCGRAVPAVGGACSVLKAASDSLWPKLQCPVWKKILGESIGLRQRLLPGTAVECVRHPGYQIPDADAG